MLEVQEKSAPTGGARKQDISSWQDVDITKLNAKAKKRFIKYRSAVVAFFTTDKPVEEIIARYHLSNSQFQKITADCLKQHMDGTLWGFRALLPGVQVKDYAAQPDAEDSVSTDSHLSEEELLPQKDASVETSQQPSERANEPVDATEIVEQPAENINQPANAIDAMEQPVEKSDEPVGATDAVEEPIEEDNEFEITAKRPAIRPDALAEPVAAQSASAAREECAEEQVHSETPPESGATLLSSDGAPTASVLTSTPDDETASLSPEAPATQDEVATPATTADEVSTDEDVSSPIEFALPDEPTG